ncbi:hypothetical protein N781_15625 [Pontibacillus halophilus JSM 076056 = DSM 19796]|uniref:Dephospho-CoA kinase n=1 Tax=Pontibacillus halophilus JSM 076056 = DSM 19796 TaxID=1385510 RepID=A0A0A5GHJ1_9BACI|nr:GrpB family protein [Pontibacillus halophilus]KGX92736.1 hypothetical protein N781_15625 [Pontibacillus halophilus JSM 076056 = DSM 19796]
MELGLARDEVRLQLHQSEWATEFMKVKRDLILVTGLPDERIEHVGSTSLADVKAKPIIDLLVGVDDYKDSQSILQDLKQLGFLRLKVERPNEMVCARFKDEAYKVKTHYIHLTNYRGELWEQMIQFRNYLLQSREARKEYEAIKEAYVKDHAKGIAAYTEHKEPFIQRILEYSTR